MKVPADSILLAMMRQLLNCLTFTRSVGCAADCVIRRTRSSGHVFISTTLKNENGVRHPYHRSFPTNREEKLVSRRATYTLIILTRALPGADNAGGGGDVY